MMKKTLKPRKTSDALQILDDLFIRKNPAMKRLVIEERSNALIARQIHQLRIKAKLTQSALARKVGTTASVICRLEDADYEGHSVSMLHRIAAALEQEVQIRFVKRPKSRSPAIDLSL
jgi:DNA-binding XRE family transcriptional regulator